MKLGWNRLDIQLEETEQMLVRTGSFLRHPDSCLVIPHKLRMPFSRMSKQMLFLFQVTGQNFTLTTPYEDACISDIVLEADEALVIKMDHILAFSANTFFCKTWRFDLVSLLTWQFRYIYIPGPSRVVYFGLGELTQEQLKDVCHDYDQGSVIGWTNSLLQGVSSRSSVLSALFAKEQICLDRFTGTGTLLTQASTVTKLPKRFHDEKANSSGVDYLNALLGLRM
jgi:uncharacterized protein (AIM24 family)